VGLNFDSYWVQRELSKKRSKRDLLCTILFQDVESRQVSKIALARLIDIFKVLISRCLEQLDGRMPVENRAMVCPLH
jgi:hypothetical protein